MVQTKSSASLVKSRLHKMAVEKKKAPKTAVFAALKDALEAKPTAQK